MVIISDIDEVLASLHHVWIRLYNEDWDDNLQPEDITKWEIEELTKPKCGRKIFEYLSLEGLYEDVEPISGALQGINTLRSQGHRVVFVTSTMVDDPGRKFKWLVKHGFLSGDRESSKDYIECRDKSIIRGDLIIDDFTGNLKGFKGFRVLFDRPHNRETVEHYEWRASSWDSVIEAVEYYEQSIRW